MEQMRAQQHALLAKATVGGNPMKRLLIAALFLVLLAAGYYFQDSLFALQGSILGKAPQAKAGRPPPAAQAVSTGTAVEMPVPNLVSAIGSVQSIATVVVKSRIDGQIAEVHFEEGQEVKQ